MIHLHTLPTFRHPTHKSRAVLSPIFGTTKFCVLVIPYRSKTGRDQYDGHRSECMTWLENNGYIKGA